MYAVIESCGKQYKVAEGDVVFFEKLDAEEGKKVTFDKVILVLNIVHCYIIFWDISHYYFVIFLLFLFQE